MVSTAWRLAMLAISMPRRCRNWYDDQKGRPISSEI